MKKDELHKKARNKISNNIKLCANTGLKLKQIDTFEFSRETFKCADELVKKLDEHYFYLKEKVMITKIYPKKLLKEIGQETNPYKITELVDTYLKTIKLDKIIKRI
jgi:hypothetical protein